MVIEDRWEYEDSIWTGSIAGSNTDCTIGSFKKHDRLGKSVCIYETLTFACAIVFFVFTFVPGHTVTVLAKGLTMALFDWMLIALMFYTQYYTGAVKTF